MKLFKTQIPKMLLFDLLNKVGTFEEEYIIDKTLFKKIQPFLPSFLEECDKYYLESQKKYITKKPFLYKSFLTVVRQIFNNKSLDFYYKLKYMHSTYEIIYYIKNFQNGVHD
jgi:TFIIF-interacting CTD phosphatase-like protein